MSKLTLNQQKAIIEQYKKSNFIHLWDCYDRYSHAKERAFDYCRQLMFKYEGFDLRIIGFNCMQFSAGFQFVDKETGALKFMYITKAYDRVFDY